MIDKSFTLDGWPKGGNFAPWEFFKSTDDPAAAMDAWIDYQANALGLIRLLKVTRRILPLETQEICSLHIFSGFRFGDKRQHGLFRAVDAFAKTESGKIVRADILARAAWASGFSRVHIIPKGRAVTVHMDTKPVAKFEAGGFEPYLSENEYRKVSWYKKAE